MATTFQLKPNRPYTISQEALDEILAEPERAQPKVEPRVPPRTDHGDFKPVVGTTGATLYILERGADHPTSMKLLSDSALRPLTYQELLPLLVKDKALKKVLMGERFWIAGQGMNKNGIFTIDEKGELVPLPQGFFKKKTSVEQKVGVSQGNQPLSFAVVSVDYVAAYYGRRFYLGADFGPRYVAPVVVGVPITQ